MAKFYGKSSGYLIKNDIKYYLWTLGLVLLPLCLGLLALKFLSLGTTFIVAGIGIIFLVKLSEPLLDFFKRKSNKFYRGWGGELEIKRELEKLSDSFSVFEDVKIGERHGNIDFLVIGPPGVFILEVKSHGGKIDYNGYALTLNGRQFKDKDFFRQVHGQTWALKKYLEKQLGKNIHIYSVLVFSSPYASMHFGYNPISNVYVIQKNFLLGLFEHFVAYNYPVSREILERVLLKVVL